MGVAQLARATGCGPVGRGFESLYPPQFLLRVDIGSLAQLVEQGTLNPKVEGSSPSWCTTEMLGQRLIVAGFFVASAAPIPRLPVFSGGKALLNVTA